jgi:hypothetical protein
MANIPSLDLDRPLFLAARPPYLYALASWRTYTPALVVVMGEFVASAAGNTG